MSRKEYRSRQEVRADFRAKDGTGPAASQPEGTDRCQSDAHTESTEVDAVGVTQSATFTVPLPVLVHTGCLGPKTRTKPISPATTDPCPCAAGPARCPIPDEGQRMAGCTSKSSEVKSRG